MPSKHKHSEALIQRYSHNNSDFSRTVGSSIGKFKVGRSLDRSSLTSEISLPSRSTLDFGPRVLLSDVNEITQLMEANQTRALSKLKTLMNRISKSELSKTWLNQWVDYRNLDLLHCAIINNAPNIITYLLRDAKLFPPSHFPKTNPYAHLAATLGFKNCLDALLTIRPDDFFTSTERHHIVKLPMEVKRQLKLENGHHGHMTKTLERMVKAIKLDTRRAERVMDRPKMTDQKLFGEPSTPKPNRRRRLHSSYQHLIAKGEEREFTSVTEEQLREKMMKRKKLKQNKITVHRDVFSDNTLDRSEQKVWLTSPTNRASYYTGRWSNESSTSFRPQSQSRTASADDRRRAFSTCAGGRLDSPVEIGVRKFKKYKEFVPVIEKHAHMEEDLRLLEKTPLTIAAEMNHADCVNYLLIKFHVHMAPRIGDRNALTLAAKARSPEAIALLMGKDADISDYQSAVLLSVRELYPDSLSMLLSLGGKRRKAMFDGVNLFHVLYSQSMDTSYRYEMLPEMTRVLIHCQEDVNARYPPRTYPLYTLIQSALHANKLGDRTLCYLRCLKMLLNARANPHYNESSKLVVGGPGIERDIQRSWYVSAVHCLLASAYSSVHFRQKTYLSQNVLNKFMEAIERYDKTQRKSPCDLLFLYMNYIGRLGISRNVLRTVLRYGANPDIMIDEKYPLNYFFSVLFPFLTKFQIGNHELTNNSMLNALLYLCEAMNQIDLHKAVVYFLKNHLLTTPIQALSLTRPFCHHVQKLITTPRRLGDLAAQRIWVLCGRNTQRTRRLPLGQDFMHLIVP